MISAAVIAEYLGATLFGANVDITELRSLSSARPGALVFLARPAAEAEARLNRLRDLLCITTGELAGGLRCSVLVHPNPRLAFCQVAAAFFPPAPGDGVHETAIVSDSARLGAGVCVGPGTVIEDDVSVGEHSRIGINVVVKRGVIIGRHCMIKSNSTLGERGFGFVRDNNGVPVPFPHVGTVRVGDQVEIGANCTVVRAALDETLVEEHVKIDDHVHIAHNSRIGARTYIAAGVIVSGSVRVGENVWIGPNATLIDYLEVGDRACIGLGAVVTKPVPADCTVFGNPARIIKKGAREK